MDKLAIAQKAALVPLFLVIILLSSEVLSHLLKDRDVAETVQARAGLVEQINDLVHQLQRERGYSSGYLASGGKSLSQEVADQRVITDRTIASVVSKWSADEGRIVPQDILQSISDIRQWRAQVDVQSFSVGDVLARYTALVNALLGVAEVQSIVVAEDALPLLIDALQAIAQAKEAAGLQRAAGAIALGGQSMDRALHERMLSLAAREKAFLQLAKLNATTGGRPMNAEKTLQFSQMDMVRAQLIQMGYGAPAPDMTAAEWFTLSSAWIDRLHLEENRLNAVVRHLSVAASDQANKALLIRGICILVALALLAMQLPIRRRPWSRAYAPEWS